MSTLGIILLAHTALHRVRAVARFWADAGCPVVIHLDRAVPANRCEALRKSLSDLPSVEVLRRHRCAWGSWSLVAATQDCAERLLHRFPEVRHVLLTSGSCLPLRPAEDLREFLDRHPRTDFIESTAIAENRWTEGGLESERFTLFFPVSWKDHRKLFDGLVEFQRKLGVRRRIPRGLRPHMGSQWWCLTRQTLTAILSDPARSRHDRYFRWSWIPDESYFQSLARLYASDLESRSLTLSRFDRDGRPHVFYDDHLSALRRSGAFLARKIWPGADALYDAFLQDGGRRLTPVEPDPSRIDRLFSTARERRDAGRVGLFMQSRFPLHDVDKTIAARPFVVLHGLPELFEDFDGWFEKATGRRPHGHLFDPKRVWFREGDTAPGMMVASPAIRDANPAAFLSNLVWAHREGIESFRFGASDVQQVVPILARDRHAHVFAVTGAWALGLFRSGADMEAIRAEAERLQRTEEAALRALRDGSARATLRVWTLSEAVSAPGNVLETLLAEHPAGHGARMPRLPRLVDLDGFAHFLQGLRNHGMNPHLVGSFPIVHGPVHDRSDAQKPHLVER